MANTRIQLRRFGVNGSVPPRTLDYREAVHGNRVISLWHVELIACFIVVLIAAFGNPASPYASSGSQATTGANTTTREHSTVRTSESVALAKPAEPKIPSAPRSEPFGLHSVEVTSSWLLNTWRGVQNDIRAESKILMRCRAQAEDCPPAARTFLEIITEGRAHTGRARIGIINRAINLAIRAKRDPAYWMAPLATLTNGSGDCKNYAIAKYVALAEAGVAEEDLRLVIIRDLSRDEDHAIVATRLGQNWIVLDNRWLALTRDVDLRRVVPLFVLDRDGLRRFIDDKTAS